MPQVTLSVPQKKLPLLKEVLNALGIDDRKINRTSTRPSYTSKVSRNIKDSASALYNKYFGWEYFSNELEFE